MPLPSSARVLVLSGELDLAGKQQLRASLGTLSDQVAAIVDLSTVTYVDSIALAEFVRVAKDFDARAARLVWVVPPASTVRRIFAIAKLDRYFTVADDMASARAALPR